MTLHGEDYDGPERRAMPLSEDQIEMIAERAAVKAVEKMTTVAYVAVGKTVVNKVLWLIGLVTVGTVAWMSSKGWIRLL